MRSPRDVAEHLAAALAAIGEAFSSEEPEHVFSQCMALLAMGDRPLLGARDIEAALERDDDLARAIHSKREGFADALSRDVWDELMTNVETVSKEGDQVVVRFRDGSEVRRPFPWETRT